VGAGVQGVVMIYRNEDSKILGNQRPDKAVETYEFIFAPIFFAALTLLVVGLMCL
jgi:hypothetical protein